MKRPPELLFLYFLHLILSLNALIGGGALLLDPQGSLMGLQAEWLQQTPFDSYFIPGLLLFTLNGILPLFALATLLFQPRWQWANRLNIYADKYWAWTYSLFCGIIVVFWITMQGLFTHYFWLQPVFLLIGLLIIIFTLMPRIQRYYSL